MGIYSTKQDISKGFLHYPVATRRRLEKTLIDLMDEEKSRERFLEIVSDGG